MQVGVLGPTRIVRGSEIVEVRARKLRGVLAALALDPGAMVSADRLTDLIWEGSPPRGAHGTLHSYISSLRRALEPDLEPRQQPRLLLTADTGYRLTLDRGDIDATAFADGVRNVHRIVAPLASQLTSGPQPAWPTEATVLEQLQVLDELLGHWRGQAYADLGEHPDALAERAALEELRTTAEEDRALLMLALGDHAGVVAATEQAAVRHPFRERIWALRALALTRSGRQADALAGIGVVRARLADELGLDPGSELRGLESAILRQDEGVVATSPLSSAIPRTTSSPSSEEEPDPSRQAPSGASWTPRWPTVGRERERQILERALAEGAGGSPAYAVLVGEPGIGKSRLTDELLARARAHGFTAMAGRCSQDDGAPPLWPWSAILAGLGSADAGEPPLDLPGLRAALAGGPDADDAERAFAVSDQLAAAVRRHAAAGPVLVVVEDLHWADAATLRALSHLVATASAGDRLVVVTTRRPWPEPTGPLAELDATLARHGAHRLSLTGLDPEQGAELVRSVAADAAPASRIADWHAATGGNPFFLVELARLAGELGSEQQDGPDEVPPSVQAVVRRRWELLPPATRDLLVVAAALGRAFSPLVLGTVTDVDPGSVDERLDPAREAGLVRDGAVGELEFNHALTRDALLAPIPPSQQARTHARIAYALTRDDAPVAPETKPYELARHWLAAGPVHAPQAWRAAAEAGRRAKAAFAYEDAVDYYGSAVDAQRLDPRASRDDRFVLLLARAEVAAYAGLWHHVVSGATEAVALAAAEHRPDRVARAAAELTRHSVWLPQELDVVAADLVEDLRKALASVGPGDSADRVHLSLALACQLYYDASRAPELRALVDHGLAMARRLDDPDVLRWATRSASIALWRPGSVTERAALVTEELAAARQLGDPDAEALALTHAAGIALERADRAGFDQAAPAAMALARRRRLHYLRIALGTVDLTLAGLRDSPAVASVAAELLEVAAQTTVPNQELLGAAIEMFSELWPPAGPGRFVEAMLPVAAQPGAELLRPMVGLGLVRLGRVDEVRNVLGRPPWPPLIETWSTTWDAACEAEIAHALDDPELMAPCAAVLRNYSGRLSTAGVSVVNGPVDGYLALAEATVGDPAAASAAFDRATTQAETWEMAGYLRWLNQHRERLGL